MPIEIAGPARAFSDLKMLYLSIGSGPVPVRHGPPWVGFGKNRLLGYSFKCHRLFGLSIVPRSRSRIPLDGSVGDLV